VRVIQALSAIYLCVTILALIASLAVPLIVRAWTNSKRLTEEGRAFPEVTNPDIVVTLVHGTWALGSEWTRPGSNFHGRLHAALASATGASIQFRRFLWSGSNTFGLRKVAIDGLVSDIRALVAKGAGAATHPRHFVIAHSHGGNVALQALNDPVVARGVDGLACLATPFLQGRERKPEATLWAALVLAPAVAAGVWLYVLSAHWRGSGEAWLILAVVLGGGLLLGVANAGLGRRFASLAAQTVAPTAELSPSIRDKLLIIRSSGDEASAGLGFGYILSWAVGRLWHTAWQMARQPFLNVWNGMKPPNRAWMIGQLIGAPVVLFLAARMYFDAAFRAQVTAISPELRDFLWIWLMPGALLFMLVVTVIYGVLPLVGMLLFMPVPAILGMLALPFGGDLILASLFFEITAEPVPNGPLRVLQLPMRDRDLRHSSYDDPESIQAITEWIAGLR
jgi:hypothetical protein